VKLCRLGNPGEEIPAVIVNDTYFDLRPLARDIDHLTLPTLSTDRVAEAIRGGQLPVLEDASAMRVGSPIARPTAVYCVGLNYAAHAKESGANPPEHPVIFLKPPNTMSGPFDDVEIPRNSQKTDWEVELAVVISKRCSYLDDPAEAMDYVAGFALANDVSERDFQLTVSGGQWSKGKASPGFTPLGPWLVTADEVDHHNLRLRSFVNGEARQDSVTSDMIFSVEHIIWHMSQFLAFEPGDVILTGTPEGVALSERFPYLSDGDVVDLDIDGLGAQRQTFRSYQGGHS
jgi:2,4-diketo-3-deoxy-L-fuconate hydrolase